MRQHAPILAVTHAGERLAKARLGYFWPPLEQEKKIMAMDRRSFVLGAGLSVAAIASCGVVANRFPAVDGQLEGPHLRISLCGPGRIAISSPQIRQLPVLFCRHIKKPAI
jgi:hypothetical protein